MKNHHIYLLSILLLASCSSVKNTSKSASNAIIKASIDLSNIEDDKVKVMIDPSSIKEDTVRFLLPRIVQGTYAVSDFGKFIEGFKAFDSNGNAIEFVKESDNIWAIPNGKALDKITYYVNDTYDIENGEIKTPFSPSGTNIEPEAYMLNLHGFIGYFQGMEESTYQLSVTSPSTMKKTAALPIIKSTPEGSTKITDTYLAKRYFDVTDNPMFYGDLDIEEFQVGDIKIFLSVYSPTGLHTASKLKEVMYKMMEAQKRYLGDINSTKRYDVLLYLSRQGAGNPTGFGALEHHTSTVVVLPEALNEEQLAESMIDVVSHEFFHIITPLSVHSEDVHDFDYNKPTFSKHLWMYEGVTEYFASHFQIAEGLVTEDEFFRKMIGKIESSKTLDDTMSFTEMSENILDKPYASNYLNVYQKGALIGMCLDILLREESQGKRSMLSLMKELSQKYGKAKAFEDDLLIEEIAEMTYPSVRDFLETHVIGKTPIDYMAFFKKAGLEMGEAKIETGYILNGGSLILAADPQSGKIFFNDLVANNSFWAENGVKANDAIKEWNGQKVDLSNANEVMGATLQWKPGDEINVKLDRNGEEVAISTVLTQSYTIGNKLQSIESPSEAQVQLKKVWLNQN